MTERRNQYVFEFNNWLLRSCFLSVRNLFCLLEWRFDSGYGVDRDQGETLGGLTKWDIRGITRQPIEHRIGSLHFLP